MEKFDVLVIGTGLTESILAAALSKTRLRVLHTDTNSYYGDGEASLSMDELQNWAQIHNVFVEGVPVLPSRVFSLSLMPSIQPSTGPLIKTLVDSGVSRYMSFKLLDDSFIYSKDGMWIKVPTSKASIFASTLSLPQKRKLMRLIQLLASSSSEELPDKPEIRGKENVPIIRFLTSPLAEGGNFGLQQDMAESIAYSLGFCETAEDPALPTLLRIQSYLHSAGRYGDSPFLVAHYGGLGEIAQGFCRMSAVHGGAYILGHRTLSLKPTAPGDEKGKWCIEMEDVPDVLYADLLISASSSSHISNNAAKLESKSTIARCIAIFKTPSDMPDETSLRTFPPSSLVSHSHPRTVTSLLTSADTSACPAGYTIAYLQTHNISRSTPEDILRPYLYLLFNGGTPILPKYAIYYSTPVPEASSPSSIPASPHTISIAPSPFASQPFTEIGDWHAREAERVFWEVLKVLNVEAEAAGEMWPPREDLEDE